MKKDLTKEKYEEGWEFTLPGYIFKPLNWLLALLIVIALLLFFVLITKVTNRQSLNQTVTTHSP